MGIKSFIKLRNTTAGTQWNVKTCFLRVNNEHNPNIYYLNSSQRLWYCSQCWSVFRTAIHNKSVAWKQKCHYQ